MYSIPVIFMKDLSKYGRYIKLVFITLMHSPID